MPKFFVSFGQVHAHRINGKTFDCDVLMELIEPDYDAAYQRACSLTDGAFATVYTEEKAKDIMSYFPNASQPL